MRLPFMRLESPPGLPWAGFLLPRDGQSRSVRQAQHLPAIDFRHSSVR